MFDNPQESYFNNQKIRILLQKGESDNIVHSCFKKIKKEIDNIVCSCPLLVVSP